MTPSAVQCTLAQHGCGLVISPYVLDRERTAKPRLEPAEPRRRVTREQIAKSPGSVQRLRRAGDALAGEQCRDHAVLSGYARVHRLGHGAELDFRAARHARCEADRPTEVLGIEPEKSGARRGGAERTEGRGRVPAALVVVHVDRLADPAHGLEPYDVCIEQVLPAAVLRLGDRQYRRHQDRARVRGGRMKVVVEIVDVRRGAVNQCGGRHRESLSVSSDRRVASPKRASGAQHARGSVVARAHEHASDGVPDGVHDGIAREGQRPLPIYAGGLGTPGCEGFGEAHLK